MDPYVYQITRVSVEPRNADMAEDAPDLFLGYLGESGKDVQLGDWLYFAVDFCDLIQAGESYLVTKTAERDDAVIGYFHTGMDYFSFILEPHQEYWDDEDEPVDEEPIGEEPEEE